MPLFDCRHVWGEPYFHVVEPNTKVTVKGFDPADALKIIYGCTVILQSCTKCNQMRSETVVGNVSMTRKD